MVEVEVDDVVGLAEFLPDIHTLFSTYNKLYFEGYLDGCVLEWSERMTLCAGICYIKFGTCTIRLSRPLLTQRPFSDTINTLLVMQTRNDPRVHFLKFGGTLQRDGHGPDFASIMNRINTLAGSNITVYHTFHEEVKQCRKHMWRCNGPCKDRAPFYGWCRRSMNRPPQPADWWWSNHQRSCGGTYVKVSGPEIESKAGKRKTGPKGSATKAGASITDYFKSLGRGNRLGGGGPSVLITAEGHVVVKDSEPDEPGENDPAVSLSKRLKWADPVIFEIQDGDNPSTGKDKDKVHDFIDLT